MATSGGQPGNQNAAKARIWTEAIKRAIARKYDGDLKHGLDKLADDFVNSVASGDLSTFKELGDRLEGKPAQAIIGGSEDDPAIKTVNEIIIRAVDATSDRPSSEGE